MQTDKLILTHRAAPESTWMCANRSLRPLCADSVPNSVGSGSPAMAQARPGLRPSRGV